MTIPRVTAFVASIAIVISIDTRTLRYMLKNNVIVSCHRTISYDVLCVGLKPLTSRTSSRRTNAVVVRAAADGYEWLKKEPLALMIGSAGWFIPSNIGVSAFGGKSLFGLFTESIGTNLANFPQGPALTDPFWLYMTTWHVGLFVTLTLAQIGIQGRKQGYW